MGQEAVVKSARSLAAALQALAGAGESCAIVMVDGALVHPSAPAPTAWTEVRLRTPAGMATLRKRGDAVSIVVFGNAGQALIELQARLAAALAAGTSA